MEVTALGGARIIGRYALYAQIASGGMASVHLGRLLGQAGFSRTVAIKRLHPHLASDPEFVSMLLDEARLAARIRHPNVAATLDVVALERELLVVMEYVHGESLAHLIRKLRRDGSRVPPAVATSLLSGVLYGLHAAHEATNERGEPLGMIHRDVSPQNVMVGADGVGRVVDFGVAKAAGRLQETRENQLKGKIRYMAPEQIMRRSVGRRADIYSASVVLWEALTARHLYHGDNEFDIAQVVLEGCKDPPSKYAPDIPTALDAAVMRGLSVEPSERFPTAFEMATALEDALAPATPRRVARWVAETVPDVMKERAAKLAEVEGLSTAITVQHEREPMPSGDFSPSLRESGPDPIGDAPPRDADPTLPADVVATIPAPISLPVRIPGLQSIDRRWLYAGAGGALVLVIGIALTVRCSASTPTPTLASAKPLLPSASAPLVPSASSEAPPPPSSTPELPLPSASVTSEEPPSKPPRQPPPTAKPKSCNPPWYFDKDGVKHLKRECL